LALLPACGVARAWERQLGAEFAQEGSEKSFLTFWFIRLPPLLPIQPDALQERILKQAARELLLAQASDWPFILRTGTSPVNARKDVREHLLCFTRRYEQLTVGDLNQPWLTEVESRDNLLPNVDYRYWV